MLPSFFLSLANLFFIMLRIMPSGSFPRPFSQAEEQKALVLAAQGDEEARRLLIEHNLRLVAHVVKNTCHKRRLTVDSAHDFVYGEYGAARLCYA